MQGGQPVDGFMGALPEGKLREFLDKHLPGEHELAAQADAQEAQQHLESGDVHAALERWAMRWPRTPAMTTFASTM
jgi:putative thioredoxin